MKKLLIILFLIIAIVCRVSAFETKTDPLTKMETSVFGMDYSNQKTEDRLSRLEETIYGRKKSGNTANRIKQLSKDMNADLIGQEVPPETGMGEMISELEEENTPDSSVDYPIINDVEKHLAIKNTEKQTLHSRLVTIEKKLFNNVYDTDDYYSRVERIKQKIYGTPDLIAQGLGPNDIVIPEYDSSDTNVWGMDEIMGHDNSFSGSWAPKRKTFGNISSKISALEKKLFNNTYPEEENNDRLARLESSVFDTEFYYDDETERINRLEGAIKGQKSANKYDNNKFQQGLNTALQIGAMVLMVLAMIL